MSQPDPQPATPSPEQPAAPVPAKQPKKGRWSRRIRKTLFGVAVLFIVFRIGVFFLLAFTLRKVANFYDLNLTYERQELTLLGGDAGLWGVNVSRRGEMTPFLSADYVHGNLSMLALLRTHIEIWRMEADGVTLDVTRTPDGKIPLLELVTAQMGNTPVTATKTSTPPSSAPLELGSPFKIDAMRLNRLRVTLNDLALTPAFHDTFYADLRVSDLRNPEKPTTIEADLWSDSILSAMRFKGSGTASGRVVKLDADFRGAGLNLLPITQYLEPLGLKPVARAIDWSGKLKLSTDAGSTPTALTATFSLSDLQALADSQEVASAQKIELSAKSIDSDGIAFGQLSIDGVRVHADRNAAGRFRFAGIELITPSPSTQPVEKAVAVSTPTPAPATTPSANAFFVTLDEFTLRNLVASFGDAAMNPPTALALHIDELSTRQFARDSAGKVTLPVKGVLRAPGITESIAVDGTLQPFEAPYSAVLNFKANHVRPDALRPYLVPLGLDSTLEDATLSGGLSASVSPTSTGGVDANVMVTQVLLQDATTRVAMPLIRADGVRIEPTLSSVIVGDVELVGPEFSASRDADGSLRAIGMRYQTTSVASKPVPAATRPTTQLVELPSLPALPHIELKKLKWSGTRIELADQAVTPARHFIVRDVGAELENFVLDLSERPGQPPAGKINAWLTLPGMVNRLAVTGTLARAPTAMTLDVAISGEGLQTAELAPYLVPLGIEPQLNAGSLALTLGLSVHQAGDRMIADLAVRNFALRDADRELIGLKALSLEKLRFEAGALAATSITLESPQVTVTRMKDGSLQSGGVRLIPAKPGAFVASEPGPVLPVPFSPIPLSIDDVKVTGLRAAWNDQSARQDVSLVLNADARLSHVRLSLPGEPATLSASGSIEGLAEHFTVEGQIDVDPSLLIANVNLNASGITGAVIDAYLPAGTKTTLTNASFSVDATATILPVAETGQSLSLSMRDLKLVQDEAMLASVPALTIEAPLVDLVKNEVVIDSLIVERALLADVKVLNDGTIDLPGLWLGPPPVEEAPSESAALVVTSTSAPIGDDQIAQRLAAARKPLPWVRVNKLDLGLDHAGVWLEARTSAAPVALEHLRLINRKPIEIGGAKAAELAPVELQITTELSPLAKQIEIQLAAAPFASDATILGTIQANQIDGAGLLKLIPELDGKVDGSSMTAGSFKASMDATLRVPRRVPTDFDLRRGFDGEVRVFDLVYRVSPDAEPVAGIESITFEGLRVQPAFAGGTVKLVTVNKPMARVVRDAEGVHVLGWTIKLPTATTQPSESPPAAPEPKPQIALKKAEPVPSPPGPEFKIDKLLVSGGNVLIQDVAVKPALYVPVNALDIEVKGLSNRALKEERAIRFSALVGTDKVELPTRARRGETSSSETEFRPLLAQVTATGKLLLYPALDGYAKASISGFELQSLIGEAKAFGITLGDGIFDATFDARFRDGGNLDLKSKLVVTDLKLSEQPNGMMQKVFSLPVPPDAAIAMVQDASGSITFPLSAKIRGGEVDVGSVIGSIVAGVSEVCATAIASAPAKLLQGVFGGGDKAEEPRPPIVLNFLPGDTSVEPALRESLDELILAMRKDPNLVITLTHRLSPDDSKRAAILASPSAEQIQQMTGVLRSRRMVLINDRAAVAGYVSAELGSGGTSEEQLASLRGLDRQIVANDDALERLLELTRPGADLQVDRRMKAAAIEIATARLEQIRSYLAAAKLERVNERISVTNPRFELDDSLSTGGTITIDQVARKRAN